MKTILVDTDVLINFLRGKEKARDFLYSLAAESMLCCSVITVAEIYSGMRLHEAEKTAEIFDGLHVMDCTHQIAEKAGRYKASIKSQKLELDDCIIAATAFINNAEIATGNDKHYPMKDIRKIVVSMNDSK
jgi:predicted nucleic acid-binding protein